MHVYTTKGTCSRQITFDVNDNIVSNVKFYGGCPGNLQAVSKLVEGKDAQIIANILRGNDCKGKGTSCADQLAKAIDLALIKVERSA